MKVLLILLSFVFFFSATNDCCLTDIQEELTELTSSAHSDAEHGSETESCEGCQCAAFCSYNLMSEINYIDVPVPNYSFYKIDIHPVTGKQITRPFLIFHPPIA